MPPIDPAYGLLAVGSAISFIGYALLVIRHIA